jgi:CubicO group peptidase (beta-lactamase class C family)
VQNFSSIILVCCFISPFLSGCNNGEGKVKSHSSLIDSSAYYPKTLPHHLTAKEYQYYHKISRDFFDSLLPEGSFNGSILVARKGNVVFEDYRGFSNPVLKTDSLNEHSAFHVASVSKTFTGMAILKLWEEGRLDINDTISKFFKDFPYKGVTVKMLLNHRSGLPNYVHYLEKYKWDKRKLVSNADVLNSLYVMHPPLQFSIGKHFSYCNTNYALLALIIETVSGVSYKTYLENTFFKPLQMKDTYVFTAEDEPRSIPSFEWNNRKFGFDFLDVVYGDKNIYSTVQDMLKWDQALYPGRLFTERTLDSAFASYSHEKPGKRNYGLGWRMTFLDNGKKILYHNGWWHGNNAVFIRLLDEQMSIIVLGNKFNRRVYKTRQICNQLGNYSMDDEAGEQ